MHGITDTNDTALAKEEATSWYVSEYKKRKGNPWTWATLWDNFPSAKRWYAESTKQNFKFVKLHGRIHISNLVGTRRRTSVEDGYSNCTRKPNRSYDKARYILYPEVYRPYADFIMQYISNYWQYTANFVATGILL